MLDKPDSQPCLFGSAEALYVAQATHKAASVLQPVPLWFWNHRHTSLITAPQLK